ncbi:50S ribosomal protein L17 [Patescibacteria group bacterium]|nr:MAG: 50S ribosomal protein L17 [Patescibacteria group bacterium]
MRHHKAHRKLGRERGQRRALLRALAVSLIAKGKIETTLPKAKELRPVVERLVTISKGGSLSERRRVSASVGESAGKKLIEIALKYRERRGGYVRIVRRGVRADGGMRAIIEFV